MLSTHNRRVGVFIDVQNMYYSARNIFNRKVNFASIVEECVGDAQLIRAIAYTISTKSGDEEPFFEALRKSGIEVMSKELLEYEGGNKKGDWDVGITIDIVRMLDMLDVVILVSGDGDYIPLAKYIKGRGRIFHVASFRESTSTALIEEADIYTNFSADQNTFLITERKRVFAKRPAKEVSEVHEDDVVESFDDADTSKESSASAEFMTPVASANEDDMQENRTRRLTF